MSSTPRFENQQIVNSTNLYIDSERASIQGDTQSRGDDVHIQFEGNSIEANDGELIRMTLKEFSMINTLNMIDFNNSRGIVKATSTFRTATQPPSAPVFGVSSTFDLIDRGNFRDVYTIAASFGDKMRKILNLLVNPGAPPVPAGPGGTPAAIPEVVGYAFECTILGPTTQYANLPAASAATSPAYIKTATPPTFGETNDRLLHLEFICKDIDYTAGGTVDKPKGNPFAHGISRLAIQLAPSEGDTYTILGAARMDGDVNNNTFNSFNIDFTTNGTKVLLQGFFPMTRFTEPSIYLRSNCQNGLEMSVLQSGAIAGGNALIADVVTSDIVGKINRFGPSDPLEFISYNSQSDEFFINIQQRKLTNLRLYLTDSKGRKLGRFVSDNDNSGTAAGLENAAATLSPTVNAAPTYALQRQNEIGNLFFTAVLKIDVVKTTCPSKLESEVFQPPYPGTKSSGVLPFTSFAERPARRII